MRRYLGEKYHDIVHRNLAMDSVKESMEALTLPSDPFGNPVAYTFMYVQWEANRVIQPFTLLSIIVTLLYNESWPIYPLLSDNWEATDPKHGARVCSDCSGQPSSNRRPNSQVGRIKASCPTRLSRECASRLGTLSFTF